MSVNTTQLKEDRDNKQPEYSRLIDSFFDFSKKIPNNIIEINSKEFYKLFKDFGELSNKIKLKFVDS